MDQSSRAGGEKQNLDLKNPASTLVVATTTMGNIPMKDCESEPTVSRDATSPDNYDLASSTLLRNTTWEIRGTNPQGYEESSAVELYQGEASLGTTHALDLQRRKDLETNLREEIESELVQQKEAQAISAVVDLQRWKDEIITSRRELMLPLELLEKIVSLIPFPDILNARQLNKSWYCNFSNGSDASAFQSQVTSVSSKWKHYCPVILNLKEDWLMGFDNEHKQWTKMRMGLDMEDANPWSTLTGGAGCLMYVVAPGSCKILVSNILTRTRKWLPSPPNIEPQNAIHLLPSGSNSYRVVLVSKRTNAGTGVYCQIYDSQTRSWTVKQSSARISVESSVSAYLNGVLYLMEYIPHQSIKFLAYNVENETCTNIRTPFGSFLCRTETFKLLVCHSHLMVIIHLHPLLPVWPSLNIRRNTLVIYKLHPVSLHLKEVARGPPTQIIGASSTFCASDNDCIYFGNPQVKSSSVLKLNLQNYEWTCLPPPCPDAYDYKNNRWVTFAFQPGINPFISV